MNKLELVANHLSASQNVTQLVQAEFQAHYADIVINRPAQMNAFTKKMAQRYQAILKRLNDMAHVKAVFLRKSEGPAFCAGGDLKSIMQEGGSAHNENSYQYEINKVVYMMSNMTPTFIAFLDGIVMGTGVGLSFFAKIKIASENTLFAMPESKLGYITDVGSGWYLPRLRSSIGLYLMLTGASLRGEDLVKVGLAHYYVESSKLESIRSEIKEFIMENRADKVTEEALRKIIEKYSKTVTGEFALEGLIKEHFEGKNSVEEILASLLSKASTTKEAKKVLDTLKANSPMSLKANFELHQRGKNMTLEEVLKLEVSAGPKLMAYGDIIRGVKKVLLKQESEWVKKNVEEISKDEIEEIFKPEKTRSF